uniref:Glutathione S-transferase LANCL1 n=1 Tax=Leptobrachium leishanense TaxID=445787 RepID=A0A8C5QJH3_9ANUR
MEQRFFQNPFHDYQEQEYSAYNSAGQLTSDFVHRLNSKIKELLQFMEKGLQSADPGDCTTYTGWAGIALLHLHLSNVYGEPSLLLKAQDYVRRSLRCLTRRDVTFLCGDAGPYAIGAAVFHKLGCSNEAEDCIKNLLQMHSLVIKPDSRLPDELIYGRMGYLYSLLFVNKQFGMEMIPSSYIQQVCYIVLLSGEQLAARRNFTAQSPLMYEWYREYYVGPAHGLAGIYYYLMLPVGISWICPPAHKYAPQLHGYAPQLIDMPPQLTHGYAPQLMDRISPPATILTFLGAAGNVSARALVGRTPAATTWDHVIAAGVLPTSARGETFPASPRKVSIVAESSDISFSAARFSHYEVLYFLFRCGFLALRSTVKYLRIPCYSLYASLFSKLYNL